TNGTCQLQELDSPNTWRTGFVPTRRVPIFQVCNRIVRRQYALLDVGLLGDCPDRGSPGLHRRGGCSRWRGETLVFCFSGALRSLACHSPIAAGQRNLAVEYFLLWEESSGEHGCFRASPDSRTSSAAFVLPSRCLLNQRAVTLACGVFQA